MGKRAPSRQREVTCQMCGKTFLTRHSQARYCPDSCRRVAMRKGWNKYTLKNKEKRLAYHRQHYFENREKRTAQIYAYHQTEQGKLTIKKAMIMQKIRYPEKINARSLFASAVRKGTIIRGSCEVCGTPNAEGHHEDYSKPLEVRWLCAKHHRQLHRLKEGKAN